MRYLAIAVALFAVGCSWRRLPPPSAPFVTRDGLFRAWSDCAKIVGSDGAISAAGFVRSTDGAPLPNAQIMFGDGSMGERRVGVWKLALSDDMEQWSHADSNGHFLVPLEMRERVKGVAVLRAVMRGYRSASVSWTLDTPVCLEMVLARDSSDK